MLRRAGASLSGIDYNLGWGDASRVGAVIDDGMARTRMSRRTRLRNLILVTAITLVIVIALAPTVDRRRFEYRSSIEIGDSPIVHVVIDFDRGHVSEARGIIALGDDARGLVAVGGIAVGLLAVGGLAFGGVAIGGAAVGPITVGALAVGFLAFGAVATGGLANGAVSLGYAAVGPLAIGRFAAGIIAIGHHRLTMAVREPEAVRFYRRYPPALFRHLLGEAITNRHGGG